MLKLWVEHNFSVTMLETVQEKISFPEEEEKILKFWNEINAFAEAQKLSKGRPA